VKKWLTVKIGPLKCGGHKLNTATSFFCCSACIYDRHWLTCEGIRDVTINFEPTSFVPVLTEAILGRLGAIEVRLAINDAEIEAAQALRYGVFFKDRGIKSDVARPLDADAFDPFCAHLLIIDTSVLGSLSQQLVGTARMLLDDQASVAEGFYSESEFTLRGLRQRQPDKKFLEIGRTCIKAKWRSKRTVELMWQGIWAFALDNNVDVMVGCASLEGTVPAAHAMALSLMHHHYRAKGAWRAKALPERFSNMDLMPAEAINLKQAMQALPPLLKGYLRVGAMVGEGCVIDHAFGTTDVFIILRVTKIATRYIRHYGADATRFAA
jgi:L-ornithine Nalpha-acyltransferase